VIFIQTELLTAEDTETAARPSRNQTKSSSRERAHRRIIVTKFTHTAINQFLPVTTRLFETADHTNGTDKEKKDDLDSATLEALLPLRAANDRCSQWFPLSLHFARGCVGVCVQRMRVRAVY